MDMLINRGLFSYISDHKRKGSQELYLAFPVVAFKVEIICKVKSGNPISNAVGKLNKYYHSSEYADDEARKREEDETYRKTPQKSISARIAEDLDLTEDLVKCILEKEELNKEQSLQASDGEAKEYHEKVIENFYVFYDRISGSWLPWLISEQDFDGMKEDVENPKRYRTSLGDSSFKKIFYLKAINNNYPRGGPNDIEMGGIIASHNKDLPGNVRYSIPGIGSEFLLMTACFHFHNNPYSYSVLNPFLQETSQWMKASVREWATKGSQYGINIAEELMKIKPNWQDGVTKKSKTEADLDEKLNKCIGAFAGKGEIISELMPRFKELFISYLRLRQIPRDVSTEDIAKNGIFERLSRQNYLIALYTFFEEAFAKCAKHYYRPKDESDYRKYIGLLQDGSNNGAELFRLAGDVGFSAEETDEALLSSEQLNPKYVKPFLGKTDSDESDTDNETYLLPTSVYVNLIEAKSNPEHPLIKLVGQWENLLTSVIQVRSARNKAKHGEIYSLDNNYYDLYHSATDVFQAVCNLSDEEFGKLPRLDTFNGGTEWRKEFDSAYVRAKDELEQYKIPFNNDLNEQIKFECLSFAMREVEYPAKLSNLYDELLLQLIQGKPGFDNSFTDADTVNKQLKSNEQTDVFECVIQILKRNGIHSAEMSNKEEYKRCWELKHSKKIASLSVRNKLCYYILCVNAVNGNAIPSGLSKSLSLLCDNVSKAERMRGHNNQADFDKDGDELKALHNQALQLCKMILTKGE